jgi:mannose-6-phosphate isomerase-like protein (cupin superfamily)
MIIKGKTLPEQGGRKPYPLTSKDVVGKHFVVRVTTPDNPFEPHKHAQREIWFIMQGEAWITLHDEEHEVEAGDLIELEPWVEHGLRTESRVTWICMG